MQVTVFLNENEQAADWQTATLLARYRNDEGGWHRIAVRALFPLNTVSLAEARLEFQQLLEFCRGCDAVAALRMTGLLAFELEKAGHILWEIEGSPDDFLEFMSLTKPDDCRECKPLEPCTSESAREPELCVLKPGHMRISLVELQKSNHALTSKQILIPLLNKSFKSLEVECAHVPPWLELWMAEGKIEGNMVRAENGAVTITITGR